MANFNLIKRSLILIMTNVKLFMNKPEINLALFDRVSGYMVHVKTF